MLYILIAILVVTALAVYLFKKSDEYDSVLLFLVGFFTIITAVILLISYAILGYSWFAAEHKARILNLEYATNYSQEDIFWASDVIEEIRQLQRKRVEVNGNILGHGKDPDKEE